MSFLELCFKMPIALLVFLASTVPIFVFYGGRAIWRQRQRMSKLRGSLGCVPATIVGIEVDAPRWQEGWIVVASWSDEQSGQTYTFRSSPQELRPKQQVGDNVLVFISSTNPLRYALEI